MKLFFSIVRWIIAIFASVFWYLVVITAIPTFVLIDNFASRDGAMQFADAITASDESTIAFRDLFFEALNQGKTTDATLREFFYQLAMPTSSVGVAARKILTPKMIKENLKTNVNRTFDWVEGKTPELSLLFKLDGTKAEHEAIINAYFKAQYEALPVCTEEEKAKFFSFPTTDIMPECQVLPYEDVANSAIAEGIFSAPEYQQSVGTGYVMKFSPTESDRQGVIALQKLSHTGMIVLWIIISVSGLIIWLLFTPRAISSLVTGLLFLFTAFTIYSEIAIIKSITGDTLSVVTSSLAQAGTVLAIAGAGLFLLGIVLIVGRKSNKAVPVAQSATTTPVTAPVVPDASPTAAATIPVQSEILEKKESETLIVETVGKVADTDNVEAKTTEERNQEKS